MRSLALIAGLLGLLLTQGCSLIIMGEDIEPTDLSSIEVGATREIVDRVLGKPIASESAQSGKIVTYVYDRGAPSELDGDDVAGYISVYGPFFEPIFTPIALIMRSKRIKEQKGQIEITYGPQETVVEVKLLELKMRAEQGDAEAAHGAVHREQAAGAARKGPERRAEQGDADAQFYLGAYYLRTDRLDDAWKLFCLAANQDHARAQLALARKFHRGSAPVAQDYVQSYVWYSRAASNGIRYAAKERDNLAETMTSAQIAEAEKLVAEWKPGSCEPKSADVRKVTDSRTLLRLAADPQDT